MAPPPQSQITYTILAVDRPAGGQPPGPAREHSATHDMDKALKDAQDLFGTEKFLKVEVKKKYTEEKTGRQIEITLKAFESKPRRDMSLIIVSALAIAAGLAAFAGAYFLTRTASPDPAIHESPAPVLSPAAAPHAAPAE